MPEGAPKYQRSSLSHRGADFLLRLAARLERSFRPRLAAPAAAARQVLILEYMLPLGACVVMTPVFEALHRAGKQVILATRGTGFALNRHSPYLAHVLETPDPLTDLPGAVRSLRGQLRRLGLRPDCVLTGAFDQRTRLGLLAALASDGWRGGFTILDPLYQHPCIYDWGISRIMNNLQLAEMCGAPLPESCGPRVFFLPADLAHARHLLAPMRAGGDETIRPVLVAVTQTSRGQDTSWHHARWVAMLHHAQAVLGLAVVYVGTRDDQPYIEQLVRDAGGTSLAGQTTLPQLAALLAEADCIVSVDTGTMHLAHAVGTPMVVMGPSWQRAVQWLPLGVEQIRVLRGPDQHPVPDGYMLDEVLVADVLAALAELLAHFPPSAAARARRAQACLTGTS